MVRRRSFDDHFDFNEKICIKIRIKFLEFTSVFAFIESVIKADCSISEFITVLRSFGESNLIRTVARLNKSKQLVIRLSE